MYRNFFESGKEERSGEGDLANQEDKDEEDKFELHATLKGFIAFDCGFLGM